MIKGNLNIIINDIRRKYIISECCTSHPSPPIPHNTSSICTIMHGPYVHRGFYLLTIITLKHRPLKSSGAYEDISCKANDHGSCLTPILNYIITPIVCYLLKHICKHLMLLMIEFTNQSVGVLHNLHLIWPICLG